MKLSAPQCLQTGTKCPGELCEISESSTMYTVTCMHCSALKVYPVVHTAHVTLQSIAHVVQCMWSMPVNACTNIKHGKSVKKSVTWSMNGPEVSGIAYNHSLPSNFKVSHHKGKVWSWQGI